MSGEVAFRVDATVSFDLDVFHKYKRGQSPYHIIGMTTPDGIPCTIAKIRVHDGDDESIIEVEFQSPIGPISFLIPKEKLEKIIMMARELEKTAKGEKK
jgi:hypothetical protein